MYQTCFKTLSNRVCIFPSDTIEPEWKKKNEKTQRGLTLKQRWGGEKTRKKKSQRPGNKQAVPEFLWRHRLSADNGFKFWGSWGQCTLRCLVFVLFFLDLFHCDYLAKSCQTGAGTQKKGDKPEFGTNRRCALSRLATFPRQASRDNIISYFPFLYESGR